MGDHQEYAEKAPRKGKCTFAVNVLKSLWWPGAVVVQQSERWINFYVGNGLKVEIQKMYPVYTPAIREESVDRQEVREPYPEKQPEEHREQEEETPEE